MIGRLKYMHAVVYRLFRIEKRSLLQTSKLQQFKRFTEEVCHFSKSQTFKNEEPSYVIPGRGKDTLMKSVFGVNTR